MSKLITVNRYSTRRASTASGTILHEGNCNVRRPSQSSTQYAFRCRYINTISRTNKEHESRGRSRGVGVG